MPKYRKKPVEIEAVQFTGDPREPALVALCDGGGVCVVTRADGAYLEIPTLEGHMQAKSGDWIIRSVKGELYPCKPDIFAATYEAVCECKGSGYSFTPVDSCATHGHLVAMREAQEVTDA